MENWNSKGSSRIKEFWRHCFGLPNTGGYQHINGDWERSLKYRDVEQLNEYDVLDSFDKVQNYQKTRKASKCLKCCKTTNSAFLYATSLHS